MLPDQNGHPMTLEEKITATQDEIRVAAEQVESWKERRAQAVGRLGTLRELQAEGIATDAGAKEA
jgi:hypothetical protein